MIALYITGTSSGIGKSLALKALQIEDAKVYGYSRTNSIQDNRYEHTYLDLSKIEDVKSLSIKVHPEAYKVVLINNSGIIGDIRPVGKQNSEIIEKLYNINTISPSLIINKFLAAYEKVDTSLVIINISSGAARHPIESWAPYCASKAAIDMFSQVLQAEHGYDLKGKLRVFSIAPGIVDTNMQKNVRESNPSDFPHHDKFVGYFTKGQLSSTDVVAMKIFEIIDKPERYQNVLIDIRQT